VWYKVLERLSWAIFGFTRCLDNQRCYSRPHPTHDRLGLQTSNDRRLLYNNNHTSIAQRGTLISFECAELQQQNPYRINRFNPPCSFNALQSHIPHHHTAIHSFAQWPTLTLRTATGLHPATPHPPRTAHTMARLCAC
jgi:hypothetical protein